MLSVLYNFMLVFSSNHLKTFHTIFSSLLIFFINTVKCTDCTHCFSLLSSFVKKQLYVRIDRDVNLT